MGIAENRGKSLALGGRALLPATQCHRSTAASTPDLVQWSGFAATLPYATSSLLLMPHIQHIGSRVATAGRLLSPFEGHGTSATHPRIAGICRQQRLRGALPSVMPPGWRQRCETSPAQRDQRGTGRAAPGRRRNRQRSSAMQLECRALLGRRAVSFDVFFCDAAQMR